MEFHILIVPHNFFFMFMSTILTFPGSSKIMFKMISNLIDFKSLNENTLLPGENPPGPNLQLTIYTVNIFDRETNEYCPVLVLIQFGTQTKKT